MAKKAKCPQKAKNTDAVELGRLGGLKGGKARAATLSAERRREIAAQGAKARWDSNKKTQTETMNENQRFQAIVDICKQYLTRAITWEKAQLELSRLKLPVSLISDQNGNFACITLEYTRYNTTKGNTGYDMTSWIAAGYWKETPRSAVSVTFNKLMREYGNFLFDLPEDNNEGEEDNNGAL